MKRGSISDDHWTITSGNSRLFHPPITVMDRPLYEIKQKNKNKKFPISDDL